MAVDQWMLEEAISNAEHAWFRTYEWSTPTLSLGYFQSRAEADADPRWTDVPIVRRATGGGAIWHDRELTYALALPSTHPLARRSKETYRCVHEVVAGLMVERGVPARRRGEDGARVGRDRPLLCFLDRDAEDLVVSGTKVLGSAQRRRAGALLQHGSLRVGNAARTPELPGLVDLFADRELPEPSGWAAPVCRRVFEALGLDAEEQAFGETQRAEVGRIARSVYLDPGWTDRR